MKLSLCCLFLLFNLCFCLDDAFLKHIWEKYKRSHGKVYKTKAHELVRFNVFKANVEAIDQHNDEYAAGMHTFTLGINKFADWTFDEFRERLLGVQIDSRRLKDESTATFLRLPEEVQLPSDVDWRDKGNVVTPVKDQGECGSCWAFSATGSLEGATGRATNKLQSLSEQQLVDCSKKYENNGCSGGLMENAFKYVKENGGVQSEADYPYKAKEGKCHFDKSKVAAKCTGYVSIPTGDEVALKEALATQGPISIGIDATEKKFMFYKNGIFVDKTCANGTDDLDHGVLAVGYGTSDTGADFWIVKNSWSTSWGESGYIRMARNKNNMCGIATAASYPLVK